MTKQRRAAVLTELREIERSLDRIGKRLGINESSTLLAASTAIMAARFQIEDAD